MAQVPPTRRIWQRLLRIQRPEPHRLQVATHVFLLSRAAPIRRDARAGRGQPEPSGHLVLDAQRTQGQLLARPRHRQQPVRHEHLRAPAQFHQHREQRLATPAGRTHRCTCRRPLSGATVQLKHLQLGLALYRRPAYRLMRSQRPADCRYRERERHPRLATDGIPHHHTRYHPNRRHATTTHHRHHSPLHHRWTQPTDKLYDSYAFVLSGRRHSGLLHHCVYRQRALLHPRRRHRMHRPDQPDGRLRDLLHRKLPQPI